MWFTNTLDWPWRYRIDKSGIYGAILSLPEQIEATWEEVKKIKFPESYRKVDKVLLVGMGGSALGARVAVSLLQKSLKVPLVLENDYHLPHFVDEKTLVILSSYSGNTEEVLSAMKEVEKTKAKVVVIAAGGKLKDWAFKKRAPIYKIERLINPGNQPRMAIGHGVMGVIGILAMLGLVKVDEKDISDVVVNLGEQISKWRKEVRYKKNQAKRMASKINDKGVILFAARHLRGASHVFKNQLNENAKTFAARFELPELDHHLIEGLGRPDELKGKLLFLFLDSMLYDEKIKERMMITEDMVMKQQHDVVRILVESKTEFSQVWELILFGEFVGFYLAVLNGTDPAPIPWVDYLKEKLGK